MVIEINLAVLIRSQIDADVIAKGVCDHGDNATRNAGFDVSKMHGDGKIVLVSNPENPIYYDVVLVVGYTASNSSSITARDKLSTIDWKHSTK